MISVLQKERSNKIAVKENVNIGDKSVKLFKDYSIERSVELYNAQSYFGALYLSDSVLSLSNPDNEQAYDNAIKTFQKDIVDAVNKSLNSLGYTDMKYGVHPVSRKYGIQPKNFEFKGYYFDNPSNQTEEYDKAIDDLNSYTQSKESKELFKDLAESVISILKSKYPNFEELFKSYCDYFVPYYNRDEDFVDKLAGFLNFTFSANIPVSVSILEKKSFYEDLKGTKVEKDKDIILDAFYTCYNDTLNNTISNSTKFKGKYADYIRKLNSSNLAKVKQNASSLFYFSSNDKGTYIGVNICLTDDTEHKVENKEYSREDIKRLCNSFLKELCKY